MPLSEPHAERDTDVDTHTMPIPKRRRSSRRRRRRSRVDRRHLATIVGASLFAVVAYALWPAPAPPQDTSDLCTVFQDRLSWYRASRQSARRWHVEEPVLLAILEQESGLRADARPPRTRLLRLLPWRRRSSAYGYAQVIDATWREYEDAVGRNANRRRFADAVDFVGWYASRLRERLALAPAQVGELYLAYHEGPGGYGRGSHRDKALLLESARRVEARAERFERQLTGCRRALDRSLRWQRVANVAATAALALGLGAVLWKRWPRR